MFLAREPHSGSNGSNGSNVPPLPPPHSMLLSSPEKRNGCQPAPGPGPGESSLSSVVPLYPHLYP